MNIKKRCSTPKQMAYARRVFGANGDSKKSIALDVGYSMTAANSVMTHIENKPGFNNAMAALAMDSNHLALAAMHEFKSRGFGEFTNSELIKALNAVGNAWSKFNNVPAERKERPEGTGNRLRTVILQQIENQTLNTTAAPTTTPIPDKTQPPVEAEIVGGELDF